MASKRKQESDPLNVALKVAEEMIDSASQVLGEAVVAVAKLNEPLLIAEADIIKKVSPTAAELLLPRRGKKNYQSSEDKTRKAKAGKASEKGSDQSNQRKAKGSKTAAKKTAGRSKKSEDKDS